MKINGVEIEDTHAEAFAMPYARLVVTGRSGKWANGAAVSLAGCATSIIGCGCEAAVEPPDDNFKTPDGRPGHAVLFFAKNEASLKKELIRRVGQVCLPAPTVKVFNGLKEGKPFPLGSKVAMFGDGFQREVEKEGRIQVSVPITSGEFIMDRDVNIATGAGGANIWIYAATHKAGLKAAEAAVNAASEVKGVILPFVGGVVASASRPGSGYKNVNASTQADYCPGIDDKKNPQRKLPPGVEAVFEIVADAVNTEAARQAMAKAARAACLGGVVKIGAAEFGGKLGDIKIPLREVLEGG